MYFVFEKYLDALSVNYNKKVVLEKDKIIKEQEQSKKDLETVCDCESYCDKYKPTTLSDNHNEKENEPDKKEIIKDEKNETTSNMFGAVLDFFDKNNSNIKKTKPVSNESLQKMKVQPEDEIQVPNEPKQEVLEKNIEKNESIVQPIITDNTDFKLLKVKNRYLY